MSEAQQKEFSLLQLVSLKLNAQGSALTFYTASPLLLCRQDKIHSCSDLHTNL